MNRLKIKEARLELTDREIRNTFVTVLVFLSAVAIVISVTALPILPKAIHNA